jgi:hydroxymethylpyrimidine/phosphomethylpyrimidine kinase
MYAAIKEGLAMGMSVCKAVETAKEYLTNAIKSADSLNVGHGFGPLNHFYFLKPINKI